jgi:DNA repair exonuclease SbcCD ATPase subunit
MIAVKFKELTLRNFMSYGNNVTTINLDFNKPILVVGRNYDSIVDGQVDSNGAGKSAILDALSFVLYNKTVSKKDLPSLLNNINQKDMVVTLTFSKNGVDYRVTRGRKTKTKADVLLEFYENGEWKEKTPDSISNTDKEIARIIGIPFEVFSRIIVFSANFKPFLELSGPEQTAIMEELFGYTELREKADALKEHIKGTKAEFKLQEELAARSQQEIEKHQSLVASTTKQLEDWERRQKTMIEEYQETIDKLSGIDEDGERQIYSHLSKYQGDLSSIEHDLEKARLQLSTVAKDIARAEATEAKVVEAKKVLKTLKKVDFEKEQNILARLDELHMKNGDIGRDSAQMLLEKSRTKDKIEKLKAWIDELEKNICPYCQQEYKENEEKLASAKEEIKGHEETLRVVLDGLAESQEHASKIEEEIQELTESAVVKDAATLQTLKNKAISAQATLDSVEKVDIDELKAKLAETETKIEQLESEKKVIAKKADALKSESQFKTILEVEIALGELRNAKANLDSLEKQENPHRETLDNLAKQKPQDHDSKKLNELKDTLEHQEFLLKLLTKKDSFIRKALLDYSLPFLNKQLMKYLSKLGLPHTVQFQPDMTAKISQFGTTLGFGSLSSGQRARVNLALAFAFRDVLQARHGQIDFCMLDECLDTGLGNAGVIAAAKMIKEITNESNMSMFVISHRDEIASMFKDQMVIELRNGFSEIKDAA